MESNCALNVDASVLAVVTLPKRSPSSIKILADPVLGLSSSSPGPPTATIAP